MSKKVMIIDDDENAVKFLSVVLSENGYESLSASDGREGMEKLQENEVDLIVLDVMMPKKTGFVLFKQLK
ncbi:MAG: response regulator, partial [Candidatus Latescibacterota bacterium]